MQCFNNLSCIIDSQIFDNVGNSEIGRKFALSVFGPDLLYMAVTCASFQISGKLLNNQDNGKDIGVATK